MNLIFRASSLLILLGIFFVLYGLVTFTLSTIVSGLILLWVGSAVYGHMLETERLTGMSQGNNVQ